MSTLDRNGDSMPDNWYDTREHGRKWVDSSATDARVARTRISPGVEVSTAWLSIDHGHGGAPRVFETMVFGGAYDMELDRYGSEDAALRGHLRVVDRLRAGLAPFANREEAGA